MPAPSTTPTFDPEQLKRALAHLPAERRASLRWAPVALEASLHKLLSAEALSEPLCDEAAAEHFQVIHRLLSLLAIADPDHLLLSSLSAEASADDATAPLDRALSAFAHTDAISEHRALWARDLLRASLPYDIQILGLAVRFLTLAPFTDPLTSPPNITASFCLSALSVGLRERAADLRLHDLMALICLYLSRWVDVCAALDAHFAQLLQTFTAPDDQQDLLRLRDLSQQRQAVTAPFQRALAAFNEATALLDAGHWTRAAQRLAQEDLTAPTNASLASLHHRLTVTRALSLLSRTPQPMPTTEQVRAALSLAPPEGRWVAVSADGSFESAPTLPALQASLRDRSPQPLLIDRGPPHASYPL